MNETILSIEDLADFEEETTDTSWGKELTNTESLEGFIIKTDKQTIRFGISNQSGCCESWGHTSSEEDPSTFVGANLFDISVTDEALKTVKIEDIYEGGAVFINFATDRGILQFAVYNSHNGYYGHKVIFRSEQLNLDTGV